LSRPDGKLRLVVDDAVSSSAAFPQRWDTKALFTSNDYDRDGLMNSALSEAQLADIGLSVAARLIALLGSHRPR
jgi:hypothetical protein